jgi:large subunit ribosomal protein L7Ae
MSMEVKMDYYVVIEKARKTGKIDKGTNEVTKAIERGVAKVVFYAADVEPKEIVAHISGISKDKGIPCFEVDSKQKLGISAGIPVSTSSVAIIEAGESDKFISGLGKSKTEKNEE